MLSRHLMPDFSKAIIYSICHKDLTITTKAYYGSTCKTHKRRWSKHLSDYTRYKKGLCEPCAVVDLFDEYGVDNFEMKIIELYPCENDLQLRIKEDEYIKNNECVNKNNAVKNAEKQTATAKQYKTEHKLQTSNVGKLYYQKNKDKILAQQKTKEKDKTRMICECGMDIYKASRWRHNKSAFHINFMAELLLQ